jgi:hypothetical protein
VFRSVLFGGVEGIASKISLWTSPALSESSKEAFGGDFTGTGIEEVFFEGKCTFLATDPFFVVEIDLH